jgi:hypothetical protein
MVCDASTDAEQRRPIALPEGEVVAILRREEPRMTSPPLVQLEISMAARRVEALRELLSWKEKLSSRGLWGDEWDQYMEAYSIVDAFENIPPNRKFWTDGGQAPGAPWE